MPDHALHYLLTGLGVGLGSFIKALWDKLAEKFWDKEWREFREWKASLDKD